MYIITGEGSVEDINTTEKYTELGWELLVSRPSFLKDLHQGKWNNTDTIVTLEDRKFLYTSFVKNIITYKEYITLQIPTSQEYKYVSGFNTANQEFFDDLYGNYNESQEYKYPETIPLIKTVEYSNLYEYDIRSDFAAVLVRNRRWQDYRSLTDKEYSTIISILRKKYSEVFVFGGGSERFCRNGVIYIDNLRDWATITHNNGCGIVVGPASGGLAITQVCGNMSSKVIVINNEQEYNQKHPLYFSKISTFTDVQINVVNSFQEAIFMIKRI
jgi:hypothetical protein